MQVYYSQDIREEELKNRIATEWFRQFDCDSIVGNIDFCVMSAVAPTGGAGISPTLVCADEPSAPPVIAGGSPAITGNESVSLSKTHSVLQDRNAVSQAASGLYADTMSMPPIVGNASERCKTDSQRLETLATTDGETPANPTAGNKTSANIVSCADEPSAPQFTAGESPASQDSPYPLKEGNIASSPLNKDTATVPPFKGDKGGLTWDAGGSPAKTQSVFTPSPQAQAVLDAGREVYRYYHQTWQQRGGGSPDASLYDIKEYFKGRNNNGKMNNKSDDAIFNELMERLRATMQDLAQAIEPKVYQYEFLK